MGFGYHKVKRFIDVLSAIVLFLHKKNTSTFINENEARDFRKHLQLAGKFSYFLSSVYVLRFVLKCAGLAASCTAEGLASILGVV